MKKILTVYTGGTICSVADGNQRSLDTELAKRVIVANFVSGPSPFAHLGAELFFDSELPKENQTLSENMTISKLNCIIQHIKSFDLSQFSGIIVLHGTDTLAHTAALFSIVFADLPIPLMLVSGNRPPQDGKTNANDNFATAAELICKGIAPNVYAPYRNSDGKIYLHLGSNLMQCENFSESFRSADSENTLLAKDEALFSKAEKLSRQRTPLPFDYAGIKSNVLLLKPYVGLDYDRISLEGIGAIAHGTYHSGTVCVERNSPDMPVLPSSIISLAKRCKALDIPLFVAPCELSSDQYSSAFDASSNGCIPVNCTIETLYAKLLLALSAGLTADKLKSFVLNP